MSRVPSLGAFTQAVFLFSQVLFVLSEMLLALGCLLLLVIRLGRVLHSVAECFGSCLFATLNG